MRRRAQSPQYPRYTSVRPLVSFELFITRACRTQPLAELVAEEKVRPETAGAGSSVP